MSTDKAKKEEITAKYQHHDKDTGSSEVQVALLSERISYLTEHLKGNKKDHSSRFGLIKMVNARRSLLDYIKRNDEPKYKQLIKELNLRR